MSVYKNDWWQPMTGNAIRHEQLKVHIPRSFSPWLLALLFVVLCLGAYVGYYAGRFDVVMELAAAGQLK